MKKIKSKSAYDELRTMDDERVNYLKKEVRKLHIKAVAVVLIAGTALFVADKKLND